jgi:hypothetical protein
LSPLLGCATGQPLPDGAGTNEVGPDGGDLGGSSAGGSSGGAVNGSSGSTSSAGTSTSGGTIGSAGTSTSGGTSSGGTHTGGSSSSSAGTSAGGTTSSAGTSTTGGTSSAGTHAGGSSGTTGSAGSSSAGTSAGGTTGSSGSTGSAGTSSAGTSGSGGTSGALLFSDDFEDGNADGWITTAGTWAVTMDGSNVYSETATMGSTLMIAANGSSTWTDQIIEARVKATLGTGSSSYVAGIFARYTTSGYYALVLRDDGKVAIRKGSSTLNNPAAASIVSGTWYTLRFEVVGSSLKGYVNGTLWLTETDTSVTAGGIALAVENSTAEFDDITVTAP